MSTAAKQYQLRSDISIEYKNSGNVILKYNTTSLETDSSIFSILNLFDQMTDLNTVNQKISRLFDNKAQAFSGLQTIQALIKKGFLTEDQSFGYDEKHEHHQAWGNQYIHIQMLNDDLRTNKFIKALERTVTSDSVVLDIGTGTGILALTAARLGAKHVYAIEASPDGVAFAKSMAKVNGLNDKVTFINKTSFNAELPEKADILVSEIIGDSPLGENILQTFHDAKNRFLKPNATIIPGKLDIFLVPVHVKNSYLNEFYFSNQYTEQWSSSYKLDFSGLLNDEVNKKNSFVISEAKKDQETTILGPEIHLESFDFDKSISEEPLFKTIKVQLEDMSKEFNGLMICFSTTLSNDIELSTLPTKTNNKNSWRYPIYPISVPNNQSSEFEFHARSLLEGRSAYSFSLLA